MSKTITIIRQGFIVALVACLLSSLLLSCSPIRNYPAGSYLLKKNTVEINKSSINSGDIEPLIKQKPNKKNLGLYLNIRLWNWSGKGKETGFKNWVKNTMSAEPVLFDSTQNLSTITQIDYYLKNHGYFESKVNSSVEYKKRNARVTYTIETNEPYKIRNVGYSIKDATLKAFVYTYKSDCKLKPGDIYNLDNIDAERDRINKNLQKNGYAYFSKDYVHFLVDTALNSHELDVTIKCSDILTPFKDNSDSMVTVKHKRYNINKIIVNTDYDINRSKNTLNDTIKFVIPNRIEERPSKVYHVVYPDKLKINLRTLAQAMYIDSNDVYNYANVEKTYKALLDLRLYRYVNIEFVKVNDTMPASGQVNSIIKLTKAPVQAVSVSTDATNSGGALGADVGIMYTNKNLFRGAEVLSLKLNGAVEFQSLNKNNEEDAVSDKLKFINTFETGIDLNLKIPRFLLPVKQTRIPKFYKPKTNINTNFNYQIRPEYERFYTSASFGYQWKQNEQITHFVTPLQINLVKIYPDSSFQAEMDSMNNSSLQDAYSDHITTSLIYSFLYTTQQVSKNLDFVYLKTNLEFAGLMFYFVKWLQNEEGAYDMFGIPYSQYLRLDADFRYYKYLNSSNILVFRTYAGYGLPFTDENVLPFDKSFYLGGANSMRAWRLKTLGPGSYNNPNNDDLERIGEIALETNLEYRFPIYNYFKGGAFIDVGNIWMSEYNEQLPGGDFKFDKFYKDLAIDGGLGLRVDFGYLVLRLDGAIMLRDPAQEEGSRWIGQYDDKFRVYGNFGIGYPF